MNLLNIIIIFISYTSIMIAIYILTWGLVRHIFVKIKIYYEVILGFFLGSFSLFGIIILSSVSNEIVKINLTILLPILLYLSVITFMTIYTTIGVFICNILAMFLFPILLPQYYEQLEGTRIIVLVIHAYIVPLILYFIDTFTVKLSKWSKWSITITVLLLVGFFTSLAYIQQEDLWDFLTVLLMWLVVAYLIYGCLTLIDQIYLHALKLRHIIEYDENFFLNQTSAHSEIFKKISSEKIKYGMYVTYFIRNFDTLEKKVGQIITENITTEFAHSSHEILNKTFKNAIFFKPNYKTYAMFISIADFNSVTNNLEKTTFLEKLNNVILKIKRKYIFNNYKITIKINAVISIFGIDSNNLEVLYDLNNITQNKKLFQSEMSATYADSFKILAEKNKIKKIQTLSEIASINSASVYYESIYDVETKQYNSYFVGSMIEGNEILSDSFAPQKLKIIEYGLDSIFKRYLSLNSFKSIINDNMNGQLCFIEYDEAFLANDNFKAEDFILKIRQQKIDPQNLVLCFDITSEVDNIQNLKKHIDQLKKHKLKIAILQFGSLKTEYQLISYYKPEFLFIEREICNKINTIQKNKEIVKNILNISKKINAHVIAPGTDSYMIYKTLKGLGVNLFFGDLIESGSKPKLEISNELRYLLNK